MSPPDVSITDSEQLTQLTPMGKLRSTSGNAASGEDEGDFVFLTPLDLCGFFLILRLSLLLKKYTSTPNGAEVGISMLDRL